MSDTRSVGKEAEDRAANYLLGLGYTLVTRRFKSSRGEIDLIALDGDTLVFVEVKYRTRGHERAAEAVGWTKQQRFHQAVKEYLAKADHPPMPSRYDLITVDEKSIRHEQDAFRPE
ncbi:MAG: YraN family protein [Fimbriimonadaceae bacterium]